MYIKVVDHGSSYFWRVMLNIKDFTYDLPQERIATYPLKERDHAKCLLYDSGRIEHRKFYDLPALLPPKSFLIFNDTKVIPARIFFQKETGAEIEVFLLSPEQPSTVMSVTMQSTNCCVWKCTIGNLKRWSENTILKKSLGIVALEAILLDRERGLVQFQWTNGISFAEVIERSGETPLPPYLKRKAEESDKQRYQTIYSHHAGAVAAPTAGLHFTDRVFAELKQKGIDHDFVTLHVSAGTFQPVKTENAEEHTMHREQIVISRKNIENLIAHDGHVVVVGTTSMRTVESLYWFGVQLLEGKKSNFYIGQNFPYANRENTPKTIEALNAVLQLMDERQTDHLTGETAIYIKPGYQFKVCRGLITNFHQPGSTLMLLVASFIGNDWRQVYSEALSNDYRFLSFGDSSLLLPNPKH